MRKLIYTVLSCLSLSSIGFAAITIENVWVRPASESQNTALYCDIKTDETGLCLTGAYADVAHITEIHTHTSENGLMKMRKVEKLTCPPGITSLKRGGNHIMLMGLREDLREGENQVIPITLLFSNGTTLLTEARVQRPRP